METVDTHNPALAYVISACLVSTPVWSELIHDVSVMAQLVSVVTGAAIGIITLCRMLSDWKKKNKNKR